MLHTSLAMKPRPFKINGPLGLFLLMATLLLPQAALASQPSETVALCAPRASHGARCLGLRMVPPRQTAPPHGSRAVMARAPRPYPSPVTAPPADALTPLQLHTAYGIPATTIWSSSQKVGIVDAYSDPAAEADLAVYSREFGLPPCTRQNGCLSIVNAKGRRAPLPKANGGWDGEISLDLDAVHATCQDCRILLVEASSESEAALGAATERAARMGATEISNSYGATEWPGIGRFARDYSHPGVVVTASTGDTGYLSWQGHLTSHGKEPETAQFPSTLPGVVSVGGTSLTNTGGSWQNTVWSGTGGGCSQIFKAPPWQLAMPNFPHHRCHNHRLAADIAAVANPNTGIASYDSIRDGQRDPIGWSVAGGTSLASPVVAAMYALAGGAHGAAHPVATLYAHMNEVAAISHVTSGNNSRSCEIFARGCVSAEGLCSNILCNGSPGYNSPTGIGTPVGLSAFVPSGEPLPFPPAATASPALSIMHPHVEEPISVSLGSWDGSAASFAYQWYDCYDHQSGCTAIPGATSPTYVPQQEDWNGKLYAVITASNQWGSVQAQSNTSEYVYNQHH